MKTITHLSLIALSVLAFSCQPAKEKTLPEKVADAYGFENLDKVKTISYTFNVQRDSVTRFSRNWKWHVKDRTVDFSDADTSYSYSLDLPKDQLPPADKGFVNDKYWLLFPFQLIWDTGYTFESTENVTAPISGAAATKLTILYNNVDGYTPGDAYDLYLDENHMIIEWVFRRGNGSEGRPMTWEDVQEFEGIKITLMHKNDAGNPFLWFSDVAVEK
ncbi:hypothetical protein [Mariniradius saccharolyticus]|nr:hypothetical protein [Mariniradius saccharolyticus]